MSEEVNDLSATQQSQEGKIELSQQPCESITSDDDTSDELPEGYSGPYKMVFVVNMELGMSVGKTAAQVAHAALGLHRILIDQELDGNKSDLIGPLTCWENYDGEKKIVLSGDSTEQLLGLMQTAETQKLSCYLVSDAGYTEIPAGSKTVMAVFGKESEVNQVTGKLKLLK